MAWRNAFPLACLLAMGPEPASAALEHRVSRVQHCTAALAHTLPAKVATALEHIDEVDRRLLALRSYLRNQSSLDERWSWSADQIARYQGSAESRLVKAELERITQRFETANPGYTLYVNSEVRSLDTQLQRWKENESVAEVARALIKAARKHAPRDGCSDDADRDAFADFLKDWQPKTLPTLAAPGLSRHGQARAFDFQVMRSDLIVAGTDSKRAIAAWDKRGWKEKLQAAVSAGSTHFVGPLKSPYEPWHYEYRP